jgi:hypothetical protein
MPIELMKVRRRHMFCGECGTQNPDTNQFCKNCGKPLARRQPAAQPPQTPVTYPAAQPAPAPAVAAAQPPVTAAATAPAPGAAPKRPKNWLGFVSLLLSILSWVILTGILAIAAILFGIVSLVWFRKATGRIGISSIIGIVLGIAAIAANMMLA